MKRFLLLAILIPHIIFAEDIAFTVTQDTYLEQNYSKKTGVKKGDIVFFNGDTKSESLIDGYNILVKTEQGHIGWIDERHILLQGNELLPDMLTKNKWIYSYYQDIIFEQEREVLFKYEPFWRHEWDE